MTEMERVPEKTCFVIMSFKKDLEPVYDIMKAAIEQGPFQSKYKCIRADRNLSSDNIMREVVKKIDAATFVIADLTNFSPNVFYELGIAHSLRKCTIMVLDEMRKTASIPFDVGHYPVLPYLKSAIEKLRLGLQERIEDLERHNFPVFNPVQDAVGAPRPDEILLRFVRNARHPLAAFEMPKRPGLVSRPFQIKAVSAEANRVYDYHAGPDALDALVGKDVGFLLKRIKPWMDEGDFISFRDDQARLGEAILMDEAAHAAVPMRFTKHPSLRDTAFLPVTIGSVEPPGSPTKLLTVLYLDMTKVPTAGTPVDY